MKHLPTCIPAFFSALPACSYQVLEDTAEARQALGLDLEAAHLTGPSDMYMPLLEGESEPLLDEQQQQGEGPRQHLALPAPRGLGVGLSMPRHSSRLGGSSSQDHARRLQQLQILQVLDEAMEGDTGGGMVQLPAVAAAAGSNHAELWGDADEAAAMAVDSAEDAADAAGVFADAVQVGPDDMACEGLPAGLGDSGFGPAGNGFGPGSSYAPAAGGAESEGFVFLRGIPSACLGGAFEAVHMPFVGGAGDLVDGDEEMQLAGQGLMQLHYN